MSDGACITSAGGGDEYVVVPWYGTATGGSTVANRTLTGLSSGEGLIWAIRDLTTDDPGITDRRLLVVEPEFASVLKTDQGRQNEREA